MSAEIAVREDIAALEQLDPAAREAAVTQYLSHARDQLALAVEMTGPAAVAAIKAEIATAAEATKQLGLSKEIQQDAQEMVRRAEYALGKAIRAGQERGEIASREMPGNRPRRDYERNGRAVRVGVVPDKNTSSPVDFIPHAEERTQVYAMTDGVSEPDFEKALTDAKAEGNLSRANVVRKIKGAKGDGELTPVERLTRLRELAPSGASAGAIARELGVTERYVRERAAEHGIEIIAETVTGKRRRLDANRVIESIVIEAQALVSPSLLAQVHFEDLDREHLGEWISSLSESEKALRSLRRDLEKELHHG